MKMGSCHGRITQVVFNTFQISEEGLQILTSCQLILLPSISQNDVIVHATENSTPSKKLTRKSKGTHLLPKLKNLLLSSNNWFNIVVPDDYYYPGYFRTPHPRRLGFCQDITSLPFYIPEDEHFLLNDIQISKGKARAPRKITVEVNRKEENIYYQIIPCGGVKRCSVKGCTYLISTREHRSCTDHPDAELEVENECPVEFVYVWPVDANDKRRWLSGLVRRSDLQSHNLHNHPLSKETKVPSKVRYDIEKAMENDQTLTTHDIMTGLPDILHVVEYLHFLGKGVPYIQGVASLAATHKGKVANIRAATLRQTKDERIPEVVILTFEEETLKYDEKNKECTGYLGKYHESLSINFMINTEHMEEYKNLGHPYICDYSLNPSLTWVLAMSPQMANILNNSE